MPLLLSLVVWAAPDAAIMTAIESGNLDQAEKALMAKRDAGDWDLDDQMTLAAVCLGKGDLECAEYLYRESMNPKPRTALAYFGLAEIARLRGRMSSARVYYEKYFAAPLPGRTRAFDAVAKERLNAVKRAPEVVAIRKPVSPPTFAELSWTASRYAGLSFFPALLGGALAGAFAQETFGDENGFIPVLAGLGTGAAIFGSGLAWGIDRRARMKNHSGPLFKTALSAGLAPAAIIFGGAFLIGTSSLDEDLAAPLMFIGTASAVVLVPPYVYMNEMVPIEAE